MAHLQASLAHWEQVREQQIKGGTVTEYGAFNVATGDAVKIGGRWHRVVRANGKSVTCATEYSWTERAPTLAQGAGPPQRRHVAKRTNSTDPYAEIDGASENIENRFPTLMTI